NCAVRAKLDDLPSDFNLSERDHWIHRAPDIDLGRANTEIKHHDQIPTFEDQPPDLVIRHCVPLIKSRISEIWIAPPNAYQPFAEIQQLVVRGLLELRPVQS